jgi:hypothetical protein
MAGGPRARPGTAARPLLARSVQRPSIEPSFLFPTALGLAPSSPEKGRVRFPPPPHKRAGASRRDGPCFRRGALARCAAPAVRSWGRPRAPNQELKTNRGRGPGRAPDRKHSGSGGLDSGGDACNGGAALFLRGGGGLGGGASCGEGGGGGRGGCTVLSARAGAARAGPARAGGGIPPAAPQLTPASPRASNMHVRPPLQDC